MVIVMFLFAYNSQEPSGIFTFMIFTVQIWEVCYTKFEFLKFVYLMDLNVLNLMA